MRNYFGFSVEYFLFETRNLPIFIDNNENTSFAEYFRKMKEVCRR